jgi:subtilisin
MHSIDTSDNSNHGNNVAQIIADGLKDIDYCITSIKVYDTGKLNMIVFYLLAFEFIIKHNYDIVNISMSGGGNYEPERRLIRQLIKNGTRIVAAAGNNNIDLDKACTSFPACYPKVVAVGAIDSDGERVSYSNYGRFLLWRLGKDVKVSNNANGFSGTSAVAPQVTAEIARRLYESK